MTNQLDTCLALIRLFKQSKYLNTDLEKHEPLSPLNVVVAARLVDRLLLFSRADGTVAPPAGRMPSAGVYLQLPSTQGVFEKVVPISSVRQGHTSDAMTWQCA